MPSLHRTVALEEVDAAALCVTKHLDLDVTRPVHIAFYQHVVVTKTGLGFTLARRQRRNKVFGFVNPAHALAAAPGTGLDEHREAHLVSLVLQVRWRVVLPVITRHERHTGLRHQGFGGRLAAHGGDGRSRRPDEDQTGLAAGQRKVLVFTQKPVSRMHRLSATRQCRVNDALPLQITLSRGIAPDAHGLIAQPNMACVLIGVRVHSHGLHTHSPRRGRHPTSNFATVGNEDFFEHGVSVSVA